MFINNKYKLIPILSQVNYNSEKTETINDQITNLFNLNRHINLFYCEGNQRQTLHHHERRKVYFFEGQFKLYVLQLRLHDIYLFIFFMYIVWCD